MGFSGFNWTSFAPDLFIAAATAGQERSLAAMKTVIFANERGGTLDPIRRNTLTKFGSESEAIPTMSAKLSVNASRTHPSDTA